MYRKFLPAEEKEKLREQHNERKSSQRKSLPAEEKEKVKEQDNERKSSYRISFPAEQKEKVKDRIMKENHRTGNLCLLKRKKK